VKSIVLCLVGSAAMHNMNAENKACVFACLLVTRERVGQSSPNFQGSSRAPMGLFKVHKVGIRVVGRRGHD